MSLWKAILLGLIQGITEFLPVSSSGHLAIFQYIFKVNTDTGMLFEVMLHLGTLISVCIVFWKDIRKLFIEGIHVLVDAFVNLKIKLTKSDEKYRRIVTNAYRKFVLLILATSVPTALIGLILNNVMEAATNSLLVPGICLIINAIILLVVGSLPGGKKKVKKTSYKEAAVIGVAQGLAVLPGISRSGSTISACLGLGFDRSFAVKYSFIASLPAIIGANLLELRHLGEAVSSGGEILYYAAGMIVAGIAGYICIRIMMRVVSEKKFSYFAYYCAIVGVISLIFHFFIIK
ncbi:MAG: undecaprenyl-diphosphate phosphatase [Frisingicoccus sp.]|uniref:undecaprenyl-diphosphate phosphatase n=1 Tax=Frisingicoccus sp. TaxID=1918627 RepID=UPI002A7EEE09|nr:undecaprenyl-diphosphate phosphatase [Frisingicoccus sp.]MDY4834949.1 undecaprenyl-diphosphate phosphatase [Frisingicoccus sp.]